MLGHYCCKVPPLIIARYGSCIIETTRCYNLNFHGFAIKFVVNSVFIALSNDCYWPIAATFKRLSPPKKSKTPFETLRATKQRGAPRRQA